MNCALYIRSSRVSKDRGTKLNQLNDLREYAEKNNWKIYKEYIDEGRSGKDNNREAFNKMFFDAHKRLFDIVLFWDITRFSRSGTLYTLQKLNELENLGVKWHSFNEPYCSTMSESVKEIVISVLSFVGKMEYEKISERTKAALRRRKAEGGKLGRIKGSKDAKKRKRRYFKKPKFAPPLYP